MSQDFCAKDVSYLRELSFGGGDLEDKFCIATETIVKGCVRDKIWGNCKFLTDHMIRSLEIENVDVADTNVFNVVLRSTNRLHLGLREKVEFWKLYSGVIQKELNLIKSRVTRKIRELMYKGVVSTM